MLQVYEDVKLLVQGRHALLVEGIGVKPMIWENVDLYDGNLARKQGIFMRRVGVLIHRYATPNTFTRLQGYDSGT